MAVFKVKRNLRDTSSKNRMTVEEVARLMHVSNQFIRIGLQTGRFKFGWAVKTGTRNWTYYILRDRFEKETGLETRKGA